MPPPAIRRIARDGAVGQREFAARIVDAAAVIDSRHVT